MGSALQEAVALALAASETLQALYSASKQSTLQCQLETMLTGCGRVLSECPTSGFVTCLLDAATRAAGCLGQGAHRTGINSVVDPWSLIPASRLLGGVLAQRLRQAFQPSSGAASGAAVPGAAAGLLGAVDGLAAATLRHRLAAPTALALLCRLLGVLTAAAGDLLHVNVERKLDVLVQRDSISTRAHTEGAECESGNLVTFCNVFTSSLRCNAQPVPHV